MIENNFNYESVNTLFDSLDATGVLSENYVAKVKAKVAIAVAEAYQAGQASVQPEDQDPGDSIETNDRSTILTELRKVLDEGDAFDGEVFIDYRDRFGRETLSRPLEVRAVTSYQLGAVDIDADGYRAFDIDSIKRLAIYR